MMKKVLIICAGGMSSSMIAKKTEDLLTSQGHEISMTARGVTEGELLIRDASYDAYLISPQTKMYLKKFQALGAEVDRKVAPIPPQAYIPVPMGIEKMAKLVVEQVG